MQLNELLSLLRQAPHYNALLDSLRAGRPAPDQRVLRSARPFVVAALAQDLHRPLLVITALVERAYNVAEQLPAWLPDTPVLRFAEPNSIFYERSPWAPATIRSRLDVLSKLCPPPGVTPDPAEKPPVIVASALALMQHTLPVREFRAGSRILRTGQQIDPDKLLRTWLSIGYSPASVVTEPGAFNRRGGIVDIYPINASAPVRIEFWGNDIESLRTFDPATQRSAENLERLIVMPAREALPKLSGNVAAHLHDWFAGLPNTEDDVTSARPDESDLLAGSVFPLVEFYLPYFYSQPASLLDYLPADTLVIVEDWGGVEDSISDLETQALSQREEKRNSNQIPDDYPLPYFTWDELRESIDDRKPLHFGGLGFADQADSNPAHFEAELDAPFDESSETLETVGSLFVPGPHYAGQLRPFLEHLRKLEADGDRSLVISNQAQRLAELRNEGYLNTQNGLLHPVTTLVSLTTPLTFVEGALAEGWTFKLPSPDATSYQSTYLFTDAEIFGWKRPEPRRHSVKRALAPEANFADMSPGDFVVHVEYGIGRFAGMVKRILDGNEREYLIIEFAGTDVLYVPIHQADRLSRYVGMEGHDPALSRLGSPEWGRTKEAARQAAELVARDLLELYAKRANVQGHSFNPDTPWQAELEASFPYIETDDQLRVLREVKADMERATPMDRLICGDVGYGKTEVALRAGFKAVMDNKQVAILVPTTVLAQQHFNTFSQRMAAFPIRVEMLSRFRTDKEQRDILQKTARGEIDILIGTHRLLAPDVIFRDLGLVVIDEEQRFGVTHKERLKQMRTEVDVLTLTATPIPRTLYMGLAGARDISTIQTPPEDRLPVLTYVGPYDEKLVRQAILRELDRDGQVFFVHNRVSTIDTLAQRLQELVPEANIVVGHGQMLEDELETVMTEFAAGRYHVLLCTTIIESGLDIPNANTIIMDHAETLGLAQLYQLRGRVGRGVNRGYAYLFHPRTALTPEARARLDTIAEHTELGGGMSIAMRDLEIRGAGDLLGLRQSGYIVSVGFHLYTQLLAQAVQQLKTEQKIDLGSTPLAPRSLAPSGPTITIDLPVPAFIPVDFIPEMTIRLQLYRRIADLTQINTVDEMQTELLDRFGTLPAEVTGLLFQVRVKLLALTANATAVTSTENQVSIRLPYLARIDRVAMQQYLGNNVRVSRTAVWLPREGDAGEWQAHLLNVLRKLQLDALEAIKWQTALRL